MQTCKAAALYSEAAQAHVRSAPGSMQYAKRSVPAAAAERALAHASAPQKQAYHKPGQPRGASLTALALAPDTLREPAKIGVRMPGDPPR